MTGACNRPVGQAVSVAQVNKGCVLITELGIVPDLRDKSLDPDLFPVFWRCDMIKVHIHITGFLSSLSSPSVLPPLFCILLLFRFWCI